MRDHIKESDWKIFRKLHGVAMERFCRRAMGKLKPKIDSPGTAHERFLDIYDLVHHEGKELSRIFDDMRRSTATLQLVAMRRQGLITDEEMTEFSDETQSDVAGILSIARR